MSSPAVLDPPLPIDIGLSEQPHDPTKLYESEVFWRNHQKWLEEHGYMLRPRLRPGWIPSWLESKKLIFESEDGKPVLVCLIRLYSRLVLTVKYKLPCIDARRISDGAIVAIKHISKSLHPYEIELTRMWSTEPLASDPRNHCAPVYDVLHSPLDEDIAFVVLPFLSLYDKPRFRTFGEAVECFRQMIEVTFIAILRFNMAYHIYRAYSLFMNTMSLIGLCPLVSPVLATNAHIF